MGEWILVDPHHGIARFDGHRLGMRRTARQCALYSAIVGVFARTLESVHSAELE